MMSPPSGPKICSRAGTSNFSAASMSASAAAWGDENVLGAAADDAPLALACPTEPSASRDESATAIAVFMRVLWFMTRYLLRPPPARPPREPPPREPPPPLKLEAPRLLLERAEEPLKPLDPPPKPPRLPIEEPLPTLRLPIRSPPPRLLVPPPARLPPPLRTLPRLPF